MRGRDPDQNRPEADMGCTQVDDAIELIRMEYLEMPGMALTGDQARRLWSLPADLCQRALEDLLESRFLTLNRNGAYVRACDGDR